jgi:hypothetical protein
MPKAQTLYEATLVLNRPDMPFQYSVQGDAIVGYWKWMDAAFFAPQAVTDEIREYSFTCTLDDDGTYKETDHVKTGSAGLDVSGGKLSFGGGTSTFKGKTSQKSFSIGIGHDRNTGETGLITAQFDTTRVKTPLRTFLAQRGWTEKKGVLGKLFG